MELSRFCKPLALQNLRRILPIHKHIRDGAAIDVLSVRHDANWTFLQQLFEPLFGSLATRLREFWRVDASEPDTIGSDAEGVAVESDDLLVAGESCILF